MGTRDKAWQVSVCVQKSVRVQVSVRVPGRPQQCVCLVRSQGSLRAGLVRVLGRLQGMLRVCLVRVLGRLKGTLRVCLVRVLRTLQHCNSEAADSE